MFQVNYSRPWLIVTHYPNYFSNAKIQMVRTNKYLTFHDPALSHVNSHVLKQRNFMKISYLHIVQETPALLQPQLVPIQRPKPNNNILLSWSLGLY